MKRIFTSHRFILCSLLLTFLHAELEAANYYSVVGQTDPSVLTNWNTATDGTGSAPANFTTAGDVFIIQSGHTMTTTSTWAVTGNTIQVDGTLTEQFAITCANFNLSANGVYSHDIANTAIPGTSRTFNASSTTNILQWSANTIALPNITYGNLTINVPSLSGNWQQNGTGLLTCAGTLNIINTGSAALRITASATATLTVGAYTQSGGTLELTSGASNCTFRIAGTFNQTGGSIVKTGTGTGTIEFNGISLQSVTLGTISNTPNFAISNNVGINLTNTMTIGSGASLTIASTATDPVQGTGTVVYNGTMTSVSTMANLKYMTVAGTTFTGGAQTVTDKVWPTTNGPNAFFLDNTSTAPNNKVTSAMTGDRTLSGAASTLTQLTITNGVFDIANSSIALGQNTAYSISSPSATKMIATSGTGYFKMYMAAAAFTSLTFPVGDIETSADYAEVYFTYSTAASAASYVGVRVKNSIISGDAPGTDYAPRNWTLSQETVSGGLPSGVAFSSSPAYTHKIDCKGPTSEIVGTGTNTRLFKKVSGVFTQLNSGYSVISTTYTSGNFTGTFPSQSETSVDGYIYAPRTYLGQQTYTWNGSVSTDYQVAANWTPSRSTLDVADIITFDGTATATPSVTNVASETIGKLILKNNVQATIAGSNGLSTGGGTATGTVDVINIASGSKLVWSSSSSLSLSGPSTATTRTGTIDGTLETGSSGSISISSSNTPTVTFSSTGIFNYGSTATAGIVNSGSTSTLVWSNGSTLNHLRTGGGTILPTGTYNTGSNVNVGTSGAPVTSLSFSPNTSFNSNVNMYVNLSSTTSISLSGASVFGGAWNITSTGAGRVRFSGSSTNTWTFSNQVVVSCTNTASGIELSTASSSGTAPTYSFNATTSPSLSVTGGALAQQATTGTTAGFTNVNIAKGLTIGDNGSIVGNTNTGAVLSGDFQININGGDVSFGTGTTLSGMNPSTANNGTSKTQLSFLGTGAQSYTPSVTTTGRTTLVVNKGSGDLTLQTRNFNTSNITLTAGKLIANTLNIVVEPTSTATTIGLASGSKTSNSWIVLTTGKLTINKIGTGGKRFPIGVGTGTNDYTGVQIYGASGTNNATTGNNNITVGVTSGISPAGTNPEKQIQLTWDIARSNTSLNIDVDFAFDDAKAGASCSPSSPMTVSRYNGSAWATALGTTVTGITPTTGAGTHGTDRIVSAFGISATSAFAVGNEAVLPLEFLAINAKAENTKNRIDWTTAYEENIKSFSIERLENNTTWTSIGTQVATGGSKTTHYSFYDNTPSVLSYYRIKSVDEAGKELLSKVVAVKRTGGSFALVAVSPVPTTEGVTVDVSVLKDTRLTVTVTDVVGRVVKTNAQNLVEGNSRFYLDLSSLTQGVYMLHLTEGNQSQVQRIVKQ
ncbi:MAG: T9SS type A sorting domain-containing protein [Saprospiraceae bacterium]|nr:T9SS type A sorting domain-containing protein [Saprospiraceae bacterium]